MADAHLRGPEKGGKSAGIMENALTPAARTHPWFRFLSQQAGASQRIAQFAGWRLDAMKRELTDPRGVVVDLSTGEYDLLVTFLEAPQRVLTRDYLLEATRNRAQDTFDRSIDVQISRLRRKIEPEHEMIKTIRGVGYMFTPDVERRGP